MGDYPNRFVTELLDPSQMIEAMKDLPELLRSLLPDDPVLRVCYGWGTALHPTLQYIDMEVPVSRLDRFLGDSLRQQIVIPGESDLYIRLPKSRLDLVFCHEGHVHSSGRDWQLEVELWMRGAFAKLPLTDCPGVGLKKIALEQSVQNNSRQSSPSPSHLLDPDPLRTPSSGGSG